LADGPIEYDCSVCGAAPTRRKHGTVYLCFDCLLDDYHQLKEKYEFWMEIYQEWTQLPLDLYNAKGRQVDIFQYGSQYHVRER